jgi:hypothetical protein
MLMNLKEDMREGGDKSDTLDRLQKYWRDWVALVARPLEGNFPLSGIGQIDIN